MIKTETGNFFKYEIIGEFVSEGEWIHPRRIIDSYEMIYVLYGTVSIDEDGSVYTLGANDVLILEPGKCHAGHIKTDAPVSFYWFHFRTDMPITHKTWHGKDFYDLKYLLKKLLHTANSPVYPQSFNDALGFLILREFLHAASSSAAENNSLLRRIDEYIRIHAAEGITVADIAGHFGYNADYIGRLFKKSRGICIKNHLIGERLKIAKDLLLTTGLSVKEISARLNFAEENLFIKFFSYHEEISPTRFRNKYSELHMNNS